MHGGEVNTAGDLHPWRGGELGELEDCFPLAQPLQFQRPVTCSEATFPVVALVSVESIVPDCCVRSIVNVILSPSSDSHTCVALRLCISTAIALFEYVPGPLKFWTLNTTPQTCPLESSV